MPLVHDDQQRKSAEEPNYTKYQTCASAFISAMHKCMSKLMQIMKLEGITQNEDKNSLLYENTTKC